MTIPPLDVQRHLFNSILQELLGEAILNNLFQRQSGLWQANCRLSNGTTDFGVGPTPYDALRATAALKHTAPKSTSAVTAADALLEGF